ncbi:MAG TPA: hypothetical protein VML19_22785 [Verrucomicrobiae bacterium]|nr:hypothetical protein [Verrucomicrobiae bacterium]
MIRFLELMAAALFSLAMLAHSAAGQALPESTAGTAGTVGTAGAANGIGQSVGGIVGNLEKSLQGDSTATKTPPPAAPPSGRTTVPRRRIPATPTATNSSKKPAPEPPAPKYEDPNQIRVSMTYDEVLRRFGPPAMEITTESSAKKLLYMPASGSVHVEVVDGVVTVAPKPKS